MVILEEAPIRTTSFSLDRTTYAKARLADIIGQIGSILALVLLLAVFLCFEKGQDPGLRSILFGVLGCSIVLVVAIPMIILGRIFKNSSRHLLESIRRFEFTEDAIYVNATDLGESRYSWRLITRISGPKGWTFLMQSSLVAVAVPDSAFSNPQDLKSFHELLERKATLLSGKHR